MPVLVPEPTIRGEISKCFLQSNSKVAVIGGTTLQIHACLIFDNSIPESRMICRNNVAYSSVVFDTSVEIRQVLIKSLDLNIPIDINASNEIACRSRGTPRILNNLLRRVRDFAEVDGDGKITHEITIKSLEALKIDKKGLDEMDNKIINVIIKKFNGGPVGIKTIATACGEEANTIEEVYEPFLVQQGYIKRTSKGRVTTKLGYDHLGLKPDSGYQNSIFE